MPSINHKQGKIELTIEYTHDHDKGVWRDKNGEGHPPSDHFQIEKIYWNDLDVTDLLLEVNDTLTEELYEAIESNEPNEYDPEDFKD